jgi:S1-C subfamily serine protease
VYKRIIKSQLFIFYLLLGGLSAQAQVTGAGNGAPVAPATPAVPARGAVIVQTQAAGAPQVVTVVHRLSGMKVLSLLHRVGQSPKVVGDEFLTAREMLTNVTAGFALGDGRSVIARLPQAEAEFGFNFYWSVPPTPSMPMGGSATPTAPAAPTFNFQTPPELEVIQRDGKMREARYVGLDGETGLSLIQVEGLKTAPLRRDAVEAKLALGQRLRLLAPQRVNPASPDAPTPAPGKLYMAVGEVEGSIAELKRSPNGQLFGLIVRAPKLSNAFAGGIALNDAGETVGVVESSDSGEARLMPMALVRRAAERVLARRGNVPQPWLGVRGQAVAFAPLAQFLSRGWTQEEAALLRAKQDGILLTAVAPNTPAALANLRSGDVIVKLNEAKVKTIEDFSFMLKEVGSGATVNFTVLRGDHLQAAPMLMPAPPQPPAPKGPETFGLLKPLVVSVKLSESLNPVRSTWEAQTRVNFNSTDPLAAAGVESIPLTPKAAARLGATGGLLVVYVEQDSDGARAGLRPFDIIESVDGQPATMPNAATFLNPNNSPKKTLTVIRNRQKFTFSFSFSNKTPKQ